MSTRDAVIIGGGLIGCAIAWELRQAGLGVTLLERRQPGEEASTAAAGMLAPSAEIVHGVETLPLALASAELYPSFLADIERQSHLPVGHRREGTLLVALNEGEAQRLDQFVVLAQAKSLAPVVLSAEEARRREPKLSEGVVKAVHLASDTQLDPRALMQAVLLVAKHRGVEVRPGVAAQAVAHEEGCVVGVETSAGCLRADIVVNAAGAWAGTIGGCEQYAPTRPVRGQIVKVRAVPPALTHVVRSERGYLVPRADGCVLVGSTMEDVGYDRRVTLEGVRSLLAMAHELIPCLSEAEFETAWAGLRPDSPDHKPILGATEIEGLFIATGHYRNGILLAPITARLMRELIVERRTSLSLHEFSPLRFASGRQSA